MDLAEPGKPVNQIVEGRAKDEEEGHDGQRSPKDQVATPPAQHGDDGQNGGQYADVAGTLDIVLHAPVDRVDRLAQGVDRDSLDLSTE